jgi:hypothetical protein
MKMLKHRFAILAPILWMLIGNIGMAAQVTRTLAIVPLIANAAPVPGEDSMSARIKACILMGDVACISTQWMAFKGVERAPEWLSVFQKSFELENRRAGHCVKVATSIHEGLTRLGQRPDFLRITLSGEHRKILGFDEIVNGLFVRSHQLATNGYHVAVRLNGRIIDAYTGLAGLPEEEYLRRLVPYPGMTMMTEVVERL